MTNGLFFTLVKKKLIIILGSHFVELLIGNMEKHHFQIDLMNESNFKRSFYTATPLLQTNLVTTFDG